MYTLVGVDGNPFVVMGYVIRIMLKEGFTREECDAYTTAAMSGDYNNLLCVSIDYVERCNARCADNADN